MALVWTLYLVFFTGAHLGEGMRKRRDQGRSISQALQAELEHFDLVNKLRKQGYTCPGGQHFPPISSPLKFDCRLWRASQKHSKDMADNNYFSHSSQDGRSPWDRARAEGIQAGGENIAAGSSTASAVLEQWKRSDGHCKNMMNSGFKTFAVGYASNTRATYRHYWTQMFARTTHADESCLHGVRSISVSHDDVDHAEAEAPLGEPWNAIEDVPPIKGFAAGAAWEILHACNTCGLTDGTLVRVTSFSECESLCSNSNTSYLTFNDIFNYCRCHNTCPKPGWPDCQCHSHVNVYSKIPGAPSPQPVPTPQPTPNPWSIQHECSYCRSTDVPAWQPKTSLQECQSLCSSTSFMTHNSRTNSCKCHDVCESVQPDCECDVNIYTKAAE